MEFYVSQDQGLRNRQEDSFIALNSDSLSSFYALAVIADGIGKLDEGDIASMIVCRELDQWFRSTLPNNQGRYVDIVLSLRKTLQEICSLMKKRAETMGLVLGAAYRLIFIRDNKLLTYFLGDCKACLIRGNEANWLSYQEDKIDESNHVLTDALSSITDFDNVLNCFREYTTTLSKGDIVVLASDGAWDKLQPIDLIGLNVEEIPAFLVEATTGLDNKDNKTVIAFEFNEDSP